MTDPVRVLHLVGSAVDDFYADLSLLYARDCWAATKHLGHEFVVAHVGPDGRWRFPADLSAAAVAAAPPMDLPQALAQLQAMHIEVMVPQMFCIPGMTTYRGLFDLLGVPYVGNVPDVMALGAHKPRARAIVAAAGVDVPRGEVVRAGQRPTVPIPFVVKPVDTDNSLGLGLVRHPAELEPVLAEAFRHTDEVLMERYVELGREVRCGVIERDCELVALPLEEYAMDPGSKPIRDHDDKIARDDTGGMALMAKDGLRAWIVPADDPLTAVVGRAAIACHRALGCRDYSLFDFRIDPEGRPWFLEASLYCSFAQQSVLVMMAAAAGIRLPQLFGDALARSARS